MHHRAIVGIGQEPRDLMQLPSPKSSMMDSTLDKLLSTVEVSPQPFSVCRIQSGWRMSFPVFSMITVHFVLRGHGQVRVGAAAPLAFAPSSVMIVPARQPHWIGDANSSAAVVAAGEKCDLIGDGLVEFTAGDGEGDTLLLCAAVSAPHHAALGLFELPRGPVIEDDLINGIPTYIFDAMRQEIARAGLGTQAMCQALMKQALISLLRSRWSQADCDTLPAAAFRHPRLARAIVAVIDDPAANHSVSSLAELAGMSRASFSDHFTRAFAQGPIDFVQKTRLRAAARLLEVSDLPVKAIALSVGYAGSRPFSRAFEATYGALPTAYRDQLMQRAPLHISG